MAEEADSNGGENSTWTKAESTFNNKRYSEYFDPCQEAASRSMRCLHRNRGDREFCSDFFQAYRDCKKEWTTARVEANRKEGVTVSS